MTIPPKKKSKNYPWGGGRGKSKNVNSLVDQIQTVVESICNRMLKWEGKQQREGRTGLPSRLIQGKTGTGKECGFNNR